MLTHFGITRVPNQSTSLPHPPKAAQAFDGEPYELVFSDEIEIENRTFYPWDDPYWELEGHLVRHHE